LFNLNIAQKNNEKKLLKLVKWNHLSNTTVQLGGVFKGCRNTDNKMELVAEAEMKDIEYTVQKGK
jgi:hypothetical protein